MILQWHAVVGKYPSCHIRILDNNKNISGHYRSIVYTHWLLTRCNIYYNRKEKMKWKKKKIECNELRKKKKKWREKRKRKRTKKETTSSSLPTDSKKKKKSTPNARYWESKKVRQERMRGKKHADWTFGQTIQNCLKTDML